MRVQSWFGQTRQYEILVRSNFRKFIKIRRQSREHIWSRTVLPVGLCSSIPGFEYYSIPRRIEWNRFRFMESTSKIAKYVWITKKRIYISVFQGCVVTKHSAEHSLDAKLVGSEVLWPLSCLYGYFFQKMILCASYSRKVELAFDVCCVAYTV